MADQMIFKRYEMKYVMDSETMMAVEEEMASYMEADPHGHSRIQSLYFDTPNYILARRSLEHPLYKEKLRLRSYGIAKVGSPTFLELKKRTFPQLIFDWPQERISPQRKNWRRRFSLNPSKAETGRS